MHRSRNVNCHFLLMHSFFLLFVFNSFCWSCCCHFLLISINHISQCSCRCYCAFMFWRDETMSSLLQFKQFMCTNILTVRAWLLMSSLTHRTQHGSYCMCCCWRWRWWWEMDEENLTIFLFFSSSFVAIYFFIKPNKEIAIFPVIKFFSFFFSHCDIEESSPSSLLWYIAIFAFFTLNKKNTLIHNDDTWLKFLICYQ